MIPNPIFRFGRERLAEAVPQELDLNPVVVYPKGQGCVALDALMLVG